jgi:hypothetical protein
MYPSLEDSNRNGAIPCNNDVGRKSQMYKILQMAKLFKQEAFLFLVYVSGSTRSSINREFTETESTVSDDVTIYYFMKSATHTYSKQQKI